MSIILWCRSAADVSRSDMQRNLFSDYGGSFDAKHLAWPKQMNVGHLPSIQGLRRNHASPLKAGCLGNLFLRLVGLLAKEAHQCGVYFFRVCPRDAVGRPSRPAGVLL